MSEDLQTVWIEFNDKAPPITLNDVQYVEILDELIKITWIRGKGMQINYYPIRRIQRIHETIKGEVA